MNTIVFRCSFIRMKEVQHGIGNQNGSLLCEVARLMRRPYGKQRMFLRTALRIYRSTTIFKELGLQFPHESHLKQPNIICESTKRSKNPKNIRFFFVFITHILVFFLLRLILFFTFYFRVVRSDCQSGNEKKNTTSHMKSRTETNFQVGLYTAVKKASNGGKRLMSNGSEWI